MERAELRAQLIEAGGVAAGDFVFLVNPLWRESEGAALAICRQAAEHADGREGWICIPTGGSSGQVRFARHDERTLAAAVAGFCQHFALNRVNAVNVLPLHHVSGLMAWLRCRATGGRHLAWDWKRLAEGVWPTVESASGPWVLSLVPTQLQRLLELPGGPDFLRDFEIVFVGGGPAWPALTEAAARAGVRVALSYGMTETAAMVAAQRPEDFLGGVRDSGKTMPHATISVGLEGKSTGEKGEYGTLQISGESVFRGYFPEFRTDRTFVTEDLGRFTEAGGLQVLGRRDSVVITGGEKVWPAEVEAALREAGGFADVAVLGVPHPRWGQEVVACYPAEGSTLDRPALEQRLATLLARYKHPKRYLALDVWPRNEQGKVNRAELLARIDSAGR